MVVAYTYGSRSGRKRPRLKKPKPKDLYKKELKDPLKDVPKPSAYTAKGQRKLLPLDQVAVSETELNASICRDSFFEFVKEFWSVLIPEKAVWNWHMEFLCDEFQAAAERVFRGQAKLYDEVINISPGTSKSSIASIFFPCWVWTRMPSFRFIGASYSFPLAMDLSRKSRDIVTSDKYLEYFPEIKLRLDQNTKGYFTNTKGGYRYAVGINGSVTGMHGHAIVIDDPLDPNQAISPADLKAANTWIKETLSSRKVDKAVTPTFLIMQRLHQDDPSEQFLKKKRVRHVCLPAEISDNDQDAMVKPASLKRFYVDGLMDPVRLGYDVLAEAKENGEYYYSAQFRQHPVPAGGGMFKTKMVRHGPGVVPPDRFKRIVRYWDKAGTRGGGAWTVGTKMGQDYDGRFWVLDVQRFQEDSYVRERKIKQIADMDGIEVIVGIEEEPGSGGKGSAQDTVARLAGYRVVTQKVSASDGDKVQRADPFSVQVNAGNVYLNHGHWNEAWLEEFKFFPFSRYKDQVDSASGAFSICHKVRRRVGGLG